MAAEEFSALTTGTAQKLLVLRMRLVRGKESRLTKAVGVRGGLIICSTESTTENQL
jgi:hypothetical protein